MANSLPFFNPSAFPRTPFLHRPPSRIVRRNRPLIGGGMKLPGVSGGEPSKNVPGVANVSNGPASSGVPGGSIANIPIWAKLVLGSLFCLAVPFYKKVLRVEDRMEKTAEMVVEVVEKVAETAEKVASDIADALPDNSKLKQEVMDVERFAEKLDKDAEKLDEFIHKVDHITDELEELVEGGEKVANKTEEKAKEEIVSSSNL